jgi:hypothetical protein
VLERALVQGLARPGQVGHHDAGDSDAELLVVGYRWTSVGVVLSPTCMTLDARSGNLVELEPRYGIEP